MVIEKLISLIKSLSENLNDEELGYESELTNIGFNSILFIRFVVMIEMEFQISFDDSSLDYSKFRTVGDVAEYIESKISH